MIINGELDDRARRRRLPGLDDGLQRRVRGGPADHRRGRTTRSTSATTRRAATRPSTTRTSTCGSSTTPAHWLLLRTFVGSVVAHRRPLRDADRTAGSSAETAPLVVAGQPPVKKTSRPDAEAGARRSSTSRRRRRSRRASAGGVYAPDGKLLYDDDVVLVLPRRAGARPRRARSRSRSRSRRSGRPRRRRRSRPSRCELCRASDRLDEPGGTRVGRKRRGVDARVRRPAVGEQLAVPRDRVLVAEARAAHVDAARVDVRAGRRRRPGAR